MPLLDKWLCARADRNKPAAPRAAPRPLADHPARQPLGHRAAPFAAVTLRPAARPCKEAKRLAGRRLLAVEAPPLPLPTCGVLCTCTYRRHADRRQDARRGIDVGISGSYYFGPDRRARPDRRVAPRLDGERDYYDYVARARARATPRP